MSDQERFLVDSERRDEIERQDFDKTRRIRRFPENVDVSDEEAAAKTRAECPTIDVACKHCAYTTVLALGRNARCPICGKEML
jgi:rubrerythrin